MGSSSAKWRVALVISCAIAISYFDRQTLPVAVAAIQRDIPLSNSAYSVLQSAFLLAYALLYAGGGKLLDVLGTRRGFLLIMVWWSLACASHGLATGFATLTASRFLLGMGEGGGFPAATKAVSEWFTAAERSSAMGIINAGTAFGAVAAPPLIAAILSYANWRWVFFAAGAAGLLWSAWWWKDYRPPELSQQEDMRPGESWASLLRFRQVWGLVAAKFLSDAAWYFYLFWLPKYLYDVRKFDIKQVGYFAWIPYAASGVGCLAGGYLSSWLLKNGRSLDSARKIALGVSAAMMPLILFVTHIPIEGAIALFCVAFFGQQSWSTLIMIVPADLFPQRVVGSVAGLVGFGGAMGGMLFGLVAGRILDSGFGYGPVFAAVASFHVLAFLLILVTIPQIKPLRLSAHEVYST